MVNCGCILAATGQRRTGSHKIFGREDEPHKALSAYYEYMQMLNQGLDPEAVIGPDDPTVNDMVQEFLWSKKRRMDEVRHQDRSCADFHSAMKLVLDPFGRYPPDA